MSGRDVEPVLAAPAALPGPYVTVARLIALIDGVPLVQTAELGEQRARSTIDLSDADVGKEVVVVFERGDQGRPIVLGCMRLPAPVSLAHADEEKPGDTLTLTARERIVLQCGEASITLTRAGKVVISGKYVLSRSSGVNAVQGGSIELN